MFKKEKALIIFVTYVCMFFYASFSSHHAKADDVSKLEMSVLHESNCHDTNNGHNQNKTHDCKSCIHHSFSCSFCDITKLSSFDFVKKTLDNTLPNYAYLNYYKSIYLSGIFRPPIYS